LPNRRCPSRTMVAPPLLNLRSHVLRPAESAGGVPRPDNGETALQNDMLRGTISTLRTPSGTEFVSAD
jgi:hypothetical protein